MNPIRRLFLLRVMVLMNLISIPLVIEVQRRQSQIIQQLHNVQLQMVWRPLVTAQLLLLITFFAFGNGALGKRALLFTLGLVGVFTGLMWAYTRTHYYAVEDIWFDSQELCDYLAIANSTCVTQILPAAMAALVLLPFRSLVGTLRFEDQPPTSPYRILDLLLATSFVAVVIAWLQPNPDMSIKFIVQVTSGILAVTCSLGLLLFSMSKRRWLGLALFLISATANRAYVVNMSPFPNGSPSAFLNAMQWNYIRGHALRGGVDYFSSWVVMIYPWLVVASTFAYLRVLGYRLKSSFYLQT